jgi:hypothetical protein
VLQPLFVSALQSSIQKVRAEALTRLPAVILGLGVKAVLEALIPALTGLLNESDDTPACCAAIECLGHCLSCAQPDQLCELAFPALSMCWKKQPRPELAAAIERLMLLLRPSPPVICRLLVPLAAGILASKVAEREIGIGLVTIIGDSMDAVVRLRRLEERATVLAAS